MPELPDITLYLEALEHRVAHQSLIRARVTSPFLLRSVDPPLASLHGRKVISLRRLGKRMAFGFEDELWLVLHLMIAGRIHWRDTGAKLAGRQNLAAFDFSNGSLLLTEAGTRKRASLHVVRGEEALQALDPGGLDVLSAPFEAFAETLTRYNHTLKRALTDPRLFSGIGNAYSDELLHAARLSPVTLTQKLSSSEVKRLHEATRQTLEHWITLLRQRAGAEFPEHVTAFRPEMRVHGKFGQPCPVCGSKVQRIRYADNETNYCPRCQTGGRLLADRSLSRLLRKDWPKTPEELEERKRKPLGAAIIFVNAAGEFLLFLRDNKPTIPYPNKWDLLGGNFERGETARQCIIREMLEELEFQLKDPALFKIYDSDDATVYVFWQRLNLDIAATPLHEGQRLGWFSESQIRAMAPDGLAFDSHQMLLDFFAQPQQARQG